MIGRAPNDSDYEAAERLREAADESVRHKGLRAEIFLIQFNPWTDQAETLLRVFRPSLGDTNDHPDEDPPDDR